MDYTYQEGWRTDSYITEGEEVTKTGYGESLGKGNRKSNGYWVWGGR